MSYAPLAVRGAVMGWRTVKSFLLLVLLVVALAAIHYRFTSISDASPVPTYIYALRNKNIKVQNLLNTFRSPIANSTLKSMNISNKQLVTKLSNATHLNVFEDFTTDSEVFKKVKTSEEHFIYKSFIPLCDIKQSYLGPIKANKTEIKLDWIERQYPEVRSGGLYTPPNCTARHRVAIIVPFKDRQQHIAIFLNHMHRFLINQKIEYGIYVVEQNGTGVFNKGRLMNVGFVESQKTKWWQCFIFHDIDLLPLNSGNLYSCSSQPKHMSASVEKYNYRLPYPDIFGGVVAITLQQFLKVNGYSNKYFGWGAEDDDIFLRLSYSNYFIQRPKMYIGRYTHLKHMPAIPNPSRRVLLSKTKRAFKKDGLSTLEYQLVKETAHHLYTHILVNIDDRQ